MNRHNRDYDRLIHSYRWTKLRLEYLSKHPICERCESNDRTSLAVEVHHRKPIESVKDFKSMQILAYDWQNLMALCHECHMEIHKELGSHVTNTKEHNKQSAKEDANTFMSWLKQEER